MSASIGPQAHPKFIPPNFDNMPSELKQRNNWVLWAPWWTGKKWTKRPIQPSGFGASTTNPKHWSSFEDARGAYELAAELGYVELHERGKAPQRVPIGGIGFVFDGQPDGDGFVLTGVDFDKVISPETAITSLAQERIKKLGSYFEVSVSGRGLHVIVKARPLAAGVVYGGTEIYSRGRFFTMTGRTGPSAHSVITAPDALAALAVELRAQADAALSNASFPARAPILGQSELSAGIETTHWFAELSLQGKDDVVEYALDTVSKETHFLELGANGGNNAEYYKLTAAVARSGAPSSEEIFVRYAAKAKDADPEEMLRQHFSRCHGSQRPGGQNVTIGTLLHLAQQHGADFTKWKQPQRHNPAENTSSSFADPWSDFVGPKFPLDVLPPTIRSFVDAEYLAMGADPSAIATAALTAISGALHAETCVQVAEGWREKPILWTALIGPPSAMKSPIIDKTTKPLARVDHQRDQQWRQQNTIWQQAKAAGGNSGTRPAKPARSIIQDATPEKIAEILSRETCGSLMVHDELAGLLAGFERYSGGAPSRALLLSCWNGGTFLKDRVGKGAGDDHAEICVDNLALCVLGGIQPDQLGAIRDLTSDGLLQRFLPVLMSPAERGNENHAVVAAEISYEKLIVLVNSACPQSFQFATDAREVLTRMLDYLFGLEQLDGFSSQLIGAIGKLKGYFCRLALVLHVAEEYDALLRGVGLGIGIAISRRSAEAAEKLIREFALPHIFGLYDVVVNGGQERDAIRAIASFILASDKDRLRPSDFTAGVRKLRGDPQHKIAEWAGRFCAMGWLLPEGEKIPVASAWSVSPGLRTHFAARREQAQKARAAAHAILKAGGTRR